MRIIVPWNVRDFRADDEPAIPSRVARLTEDMKQFAEEPRPVVIWTRTENR